MCFSALDLHAYRIIVRPWLQQRLPAVVAATPWLVHRADLEDVWEYIWSNLTAVNAAWTTTDIDNWLVIRMEDYTEDIVAEQVGFRLETHSPGLARRDRAAPRRVVEIVKERFRTGNTAGISLGLRPFRDSAHDMALVVLVDEGLRTR